MTVSLDISPETERRLKQTAERTHQPIEAALNAALDALDAVTPTPPSRQPTPEEKLAAIQRIVEWIRKLPVLDPRSPDELLGYDENSLPS
jgi:antitoxin VapB